jgi:hypothetical protein
MSFPIISLNIYDILVSFHWVTLLKKIFKKNDKMPRLAKLCKPSVFPSYGSVSGLISGSLAVQV